MDIINKLESKICYKCKVIKIITDFHKNRTDCKVCNKEYKLHNKDKISAQKKQYYIKRREHILQRCKEYTKKNVEKVKSVKLKYRQNNKEKSQIYHKQYNINNKEYINNRSKEWYYKNREEILIRRKIAIQDNLDEYNKRRKEYNNKYYSDEKNKIKRKERVRIWAQNNREKINENMRNKRKNNIHFKMKSIIAGRIYGALKIFKQNKIDNTINYLGCSIEFFVKYIESKFIENMNWNNQGKYGWHLDHIIPCEMFNLYIEEEQYKCFHYTNLQPIFGKDNLIKQDRLPDGRMARDIPEDKKREERIKLYGPDIEIK